MADKTKPEDGLSSRLLALVASIHGLLDPMQRTHLAPMDYNPANMGAGATGMHSVPPWYVSLADKLQLTGTPDTATKIDPLSALKTPEQIAEERARKLADILGTGGK